MPVERRVALPIDARACTVADRHAWRPSQATEQNKTNGRNVGQRLSVERRRTGIYAYGWTSSSGYTYDHTGRNNVRLTERLLRIESTD